MPYIPEEDRGRVVVWGADTAGELNFILTEVCKDYLERHGENYGNFNLVIGALECCKLELYRRKISPYEDAAKERNGDIYDEYRNAEETPTP